MPPCAHERERSRSLHPPNRGALGIVQSRMTMPVLRRFVTMFVIGALVTSAGLAQTARDNAADAERLVKALDVHLASVVGEIGAGAGELTFAMAMTVGEAGPESANHVDTGPAEAPACATGT